MPQLRYDKNGNPYYADGAGDALGSFIQAFMSTLNAGMQMKQRSKEHDLDILAKKFEMRQQYNKMTPTQQKEFIGTNPDDILDFIGLLEEIPGPEKPIGPLAPGQKKHAEERKPGKRLRRNAIRDWSPEELALKEKSEAEVMTTKTLAQQAVELNKAQLIGINQNIRRGEFDYKTALEDRNTIQALRSSDDPFDQALGWGRSADEFILKKLTKDYPDMADRVMQQKFDIGPEARNAAIVRETEKGLQLFGNPGQARQYASAVVQAMYDGKYDLLTALPHKMQTTAAQQLQLGWANHEQDAKRLIQAEAQFKMGMVMDLVKTSGFTVNPDTANQLVEHRMYGKPMSEGAKGVYAKFEKHLTERMNAESATMFVDLQLKQGKAVQDGLTAARQIIDSMIRQRKEGIGNKRELEKQIDALSDKIVEEVAKGMGLDIQAAQSPVWKSAIMGAVKTSYGVVDLAGAAGADKMAADSTLFGQAVADALGPTITNWIGNVVSVPVEAVKDTVGILTGHPTERTVRGLLQAQDVGDFWEIITKAELATPGIRVLATAVLEEQARTLIRHKEAALNPATHELIDAKLRQIKELLEGNKR